MRAVAKLVDKIRGLYTENTDHTVSSLKRTELLRQRRPRSVRVQSTSTLDLQLP
jgi:hypothetical protein